MDDRIYVLEHVHGDEGARLIVQSHGAAIEQIEQIVRAEKIDCDFERVDGFLFLGGSDRIDVLDAELAAAHRVGWTGVSRLDRVPHVDYNFGPCLRFPNQGQFHLLKYLAGLADAIVAAVDASTVNTKVSGVEGGASCKVETENKHTITANAVCVCTNASIADMFKTHMKQAPYRTFVIAAVIPRDSVPPHCTGTRRTRTTTCVCNARRARARRDGRRGVRRAHRRRRRPQDGARGRRDANAGRGSSSGCASAGRRRAR